MKRTELARWKLAALLGALLGPELAAAQGHADNSCWGRCGDYAQTGTGAYGCSCIPGCELYGDCCADKHTYCANTATVPVCPLVGVGARNASGQQITSGVYPDVYGTDLGYTFKHGNTLNILFGDTWLTSQWGSASNVCPIPPLHDDMQARFLSATRPSWIPADALAVQPWTTNACRPLLSIDRAPGQTTGFWPIGVHPFWGALALDSGWLKTPVSGFSDGQGAYGVFHLQQPLACNALSPCPAGLSCAASDGRCIDPTLAGYGVISGGARDRVMYLEIARQTADRTRYVVGVRFATAKFKNATTQTVRAFDPATGTFDYTESDGTFVAGKGALLMWGRPEFITDTSGGELPLFLLYQRLPLTLNGSTVTNWSPQYFAGMVNGAPSWSADQGRAKPLQMQVASPSHGDLNLPLMMDITYIPSLAKWVMLYGGDVPDWWNAGLPNDQPRTGAIHMRLADHPWGPWSDPTPVLSRYQVAPFMACDAPEPAGYDWDRAPQDGVSDRYASPGAWQHPFEALAQAQWTAQCTAGNPMRPSNTLPIPWCKTATSGKSLERGNLYGPNIISQWTVASPPTAAYPHRATIFWNVSTWNPYQVLLISSLIELPSPKLVYDTHKYQLRADASSIMVRAAPSASAPAVDGRTPVDPNVQFTLRRPGTAAGGEIGAGAAVYIETPRGYLTRLSNTSIGYSTAKVLAAEWQLRPENAQGMLVDERFSLRQNVNGTWRYLAVSGSQLTTTTTNGAAAKFRLTWRCEPGDNCGPTAR